ncbi:DUF935 family protein [Bacteroidota bacterium]
MNTEEIYQFAKTPRVKELATRKNLDYAYLNYLPDPDPILKKQGKDISVYRDLLLDGHLSSTMDQRFGGTTRLNREVSTDDQNLAEIYNDILKPFDLDNLINQILQCRYYGFVPLEIMWDKGIPVSIEAKPQEWFLFGDDNELRVKTRSNLEGIEPESKYQFLLVQNRPSYRNPYGDRIASKIFWYVTFKKGGIKFWVKFMEKYGMPFMFGKVPPGTNDSIKGDVLENLTNLVQDGIGVISDIAEVEVLDKGSNSQGDENYSKLIEFCNSEISKTVLTQTLTTELTDTGSYAASSTHSDMLNMIILGDKKIVENTFNKLFEWIHELNFTSGDAPTFKLFEDIKGDKTKADRDKVLSSMGIRFNKDYFISNYGLSEDEFELKEIPDKPKFQFPAGINPKVIGKIDPKDAAGKKFTEYPDQDQLDGFADLILDKSSELNTQMMKIVRPVIQLIESAQNFEELKDKLANVYPNMNTKDFEQFLTKVLFIAENFGKITVEDET